MKRSILMHLSTCIVVTLLVHAVASAGPAPSNVQGTWKVTITFILGSGQHEMTLSQDNTKITGTYISEQGSRNELNGSIEGNSITFVIQVRHESTRPHYVFTGEVDGDSMKGRVDCGEYWTAAWKARRAK